VYRVLWPRAWLLWCQYGDDAWSWRGEVQGGGGTDKSLALQRKQQATGLKKYIYCTYSPCAPHTYDFIVLTSLTQPRKILLIVLQIEK
jgi:hypothetical protein